MDLKINTHSYTNHLHIVERYIHALSNAMTTGRLRPDHPVRVQARLDHIEHDLKRRSHVVADSIYGPMVELQALVHIASGNQHLVPACIDELEKIPGNYRVRSQVFADFAQNHLQNGAPQSKQPKTKRRGRKFAVAAVVVLMMGMAGFMTMSGKMNPVNVAKQYSLSKSLSSQYTTCSNELSAKRAAIDTGNPDAISQYNDDFAECEKIRDKQNTAADSFKSMLRFGDSAS